MPVITFANSKGGSGKTTSALILACELAESYDVVVVDADPRRPLTRWAEHGHHPERVEVRTSAGETSIQDEIATAAERVPFVIVDLEGIASQLATFAMMESDLVIVPSREYEQDAEAALDTMFAVRRAERATRRRIGASVLITQSKASVKSRTQRHVNEQLRTHADLVVLEPELVERDAFARVYSSGLGLRALDPQDVRNIDAAVANAEAYSRAVLREIDTHMNNETSS